MPLCATRYLAQKLNSLTRRGVRHICDGKNMFCSLGLPVGSEGGGEPDLFFKPIKSNFTCVPYLKYGQ